jgi:hypothetical protein
VKLHAIIPGHLYQRGLTNGRGFERLAALGVDTVACVVRKPDPELEAWVTERGGKYVYAPFSDGKEVPEWLPNLASYLAKRAESGAVVIHCRAGRNRSGLLSALIVRELLHLDGETALEHVRQARPRAIANEHFADYLKGLPAP